MKKSFLLLALLCCLSASAQLVIDGRGSFIYRSLADLDNRMRLGIISFGDSVTLHLRNLSLVQNDGGGNYICKLAEHDLGFYRVGPYCPSTVLVFTKSFLVDGFSLHFVGCPEDELKRYLRSDYGKPHEEKNGQLYWYGSRVSIMATKSDAGYMVVFRRKT